MRYWVQVCEDIDPVQVDLTDSEVNGVLKVLEALAADGELVQLSDASDEVLFDNYDEWYHSQSANSSTSTNRSKQNRYVRSNYISCAERFDPVNSSPEELTEYIYDALDEAFDETNFVEEDLEQYKDTFTNELIKALNRLNLGDMQVETDFGTLTGDTKKIANTVVKAYIQAYKDGRLG